MTFDFTELVVNRAATIGVIVVLCMLAFQRTEPKWRWLTGVILLLPAVIVLYDWANHLGQKEEALVGFAAAILLNGLYWVLYGRKHPPDSGGSIRVVDVEE